VRILVEVTHPAHVHFFRYAIDEFKERGHEVAVTTRQKDVTVDLLNHLGIPFTILSKVSSSKLGLFGELIFRDFRLLNFCRKFKPDVLTGISGVFAAHVGFLLRRPVVVWDDTEIANIAHKIAYPFVKSIYSPDCFAKDFGKKHHLYPGLHELAYLHPNRFTADAEIIKGLGIEPSERYCIIRFVSWQAHHDVGQYGFADKDKLTFIREIAKHARPYITSEAPLPPAFEQYRLNIPPHLIHHVMAFADLYVGEGATMATESAVLGVPAVYISTLQLGNMNMLRGYSLLKQTCDTQTALKYCIDWLANSQTKQNCSAARRKLLKDKIDVTPFVVETIERCG
jgi:predicted glycosyltransferase